MPNPFSPEISVLVPTYRRPDDLARCLQAIEAQSIRPAEIVLIAQAADAASWPVIETAQRANSAIVAVAVEQPGQVHALNRGLQRVRTPFVAITDDDAAPRRDWLERILENFARDASIAGVGGRDWIHRGGRMESGVAARVGQIPPIGRYYGNHHLGHGSIRDVDVLKGANCSYRMSALLATGGFDERLRGKGAQTYNEIGVGLRLKKAGWRLVYDPAVCVDHYLGSVFGEDVHRRGGFVPSVQRFEAHNETLSRLEFLPPGLRPLYVAWAIVIGTRANPGIAQGFRLMREEGPRSFVRAGMAGRGVIDAFSRVRFRKKSGPPPLLSTLQTA